MVIVERVALPIRQQLHVDQLGLDRTHGHGPEGQRSAPVKVVPDVGGHHLDNVLDADAELALLVVTGF